MSTCFKPYETELKEAEKCELRDKYHSVIVNGQEHWFVHQVAPPLPNPPDGPKIVTFPNHLIPYTLSRTSPKSLLRLENQSSIDDLHQTLFGVELINGDLTLPQGVNITAQEHFDLAQTGTYKVAAESYVLGGKVVT